MRQKAFLNGAHNMTLNDKQYFSRRELAGLFGVTIDTVRGWQKERGLKATKIGGSIRYHSTDIQQFIEAAKQ